MGSLPLGSEVARLFLSSGTSEAGTPPISRSEKGQKDSNGRCGRLNTLRILAGHKSKGGQSSRYRRLTLAAWVHAPEHFAQLLGLDPSCGCELPAPLEDEQKGRVTANLLFT